MRNCHLSIISSLDRSLDRRSSFGTRGPHRFFYLRWRRLTDLLECVVDVDLLVARLTPDKIDNTNNHPGHNHIGNQVEGRTWVWVEGCVHSRNQDQDSNNWDGVIA